MPEARNWLSLWLEELLAPCEAFGGISLNFSTNPPLHFGHVKSYKIPNKIHSHLQRCGTHEKSKTFDGFISVNLSQILPPIRVTILHYICDKRSVQCLTEHQAPLPPFY